MQQVVEKYNTSQLWSMVDKLAAELGYENPSVAKVKTFGYLPQEGENGAVFIEVFTHDSDGKVSGTVRHTRFVHFDMKYTDYRLLHKGDKD